MALRRQTLGPSAENTSAAHPRQDFTIRIRRFTLQSCAGFPESTINHLLLTLSLLVYADSLFVDFALEDSVPAG